MGERRWRTGVSWRQKNSAAQVRSEACSDRGFWLYESGLACSRPGALLCLAPAVSIASDASRSGGGYYESVWNCCSFAGFFASAWWV